MDKWVEAMNEEYHMLIKNETQEFTMLLEGRIPIKNKWVYQIKRKANGEIDKTMKG